jgi:hypothetical protein
MIENIDKAKDKSERWLLTQQAGSILKLAGIYGFTSWVVEESSLVAPRRLPDGLVRVTFPDSPQPLPFIIEIESYSNVDADRQMYEALLLARLELGVIPEGICIVLRPRGNARAIGRFDKASPLGSSQVSASWRVVELWKLKAEELLAHNEIGLIPFVPLSQINGPVEPILRECRKRIDRDAPASKKESYLAVTHILGRMVHAQDLLDRMFTGTHVMIESPAFIDLEIEMMRRTILLVLEGRFGAVPEELRSQMQKLENLPAWKRLAVRAGNCRDLKEFQKALSRYKSVRY